MRHQTFDLAKSRSIRDARGFVGILATSDPYEQARDRLTPTEEARVTLLRSVVAARDLGMAYRYPSAFDAAKCPHVRYLELRGLVERDGEIVRATA